MDKTKHVTFKEENIYIEPVYVEPVLIPVSDLEKMIKDDIKKMKKKYKYKYIDGDINFYFDKL